MKNFISEVEQEIQIKEEEIINLREKNKLELKILKQNINKIINYKSKKEIFFSYLFILSPFLYTLQLFLLVIEKSKEEKIRLNKGEDPQINIEGNDNCSFEDKKLLRNDSNYKTKKIIIKRKEFKCDIIFIIYKIIINSFIHLLLNKNNFLVESKYSKMTLKINGTGYKKIFSTDMIYADNEKFFFDSKNYPNKIYINGKQNLTITNKYYYNFDKDENYVELIWYNYISSCACMFKGCSYIMEIDLSNFDSLGVTSMIGMFYGCSQLTSLNLSNFKTLNVINMGEMFCDCSQLTSLDLSNFNTLNAIIMRGMFYGCSKLTSLNLSNFKTSKVTNMNWMFYNCSQLSSLDISNFDTSKVGINYYLINTKLIHGAMDYMFAGCSQLSSLNLSNFDSSTITGMSSMFSGCSKLTYLNFKNFVENNSLVVTDIFRGVPDNIVICLNERCKKILNEISKKKCYNIDCSSEMKINNNSNCYKKCNYYHYFDNENTFCTLDFSCPDNYPHLIQEKKECEVVENIKITSEIESSEIIFNTNNNNISNFTSIIEAYSEIMLIIENLMNLLKNETIKKTKKEEIEYYDKFIKNIEIFFTSKDYNTTKIDEKDEAYETEKMKITLTTLQNQKNNLNTNTTKIDLGECEKELKNFII